MKVYRVEGRSSKDPPRYFVDRDPEQCPGQVVYWVNVKDWLSLKAHQGAALEQLNIPLYVNMDQRGFPGFAAQLLRDGLVDDGAVHVLTRETFDRVKFVLADKPVEEFDDDLPFR